MQANCFPSKFTILLPHSFRLSSQTLQVFLHVLSYQLSTCSWFLQGHGLQLDEPDPHRRVDLRCDMRCYMRCYIQHRSALHRVGRHRHRFPSVSTEFAARFCCLCQCAAEKSRTIFVLYLGVMAPNVNGQQMVHMGPMLVARKSTKCSSSDHLTWRNKTKYKLEV